jgi:anti-sigma factor RsiW
MNCHVCEERLEDFLDHRLEDHALEAFLDHSENCPRCHERAEDASFSRLVAQTAFPSETLAASPQFYSRLWQAIESENARPFSWVTVRDLALRFALAGFAIMVLLIGIDVVTAPRLDQNQAAIETYLQAPGAPDSFRDVMIGDLGANRDQLLNSLLQRERPQNSTAPTHEATERQAPKK